MSQWGYSSSSVDSYSQSSSDLSTEPDLNETLLEIVLHNRLDFLQDICLEEGLDTNMHIVVEDPEMSIRAPLLIFAVRYNRPDIVNMLIHDLGCDVDAPDDKGQTALIHACQCNRPEIAKSLIGMGCNVDAPDDLGQTALFHACQCGHLHLVQRLLAAGSNVNHENHFQRVPLLHAAVCGNADIVRTLLVAKGINPDIPNQNEESKAELNRLDKNDYSLLMNVADSYMGTPEVVHLLVNAGSNINQVRETNGWTALHMVCSDARHKEFVQAFIDHGASVNAVDKDGKTPLMLAAYQYKEANVNLLLAHGSNVHLKDKYNRTALHHAVMSENNNYNHNSIRVLIEAASDVNNRDTNNVTILMVGLQNSLHIETIRLLIHAGANPKAVDNDGNTVLIHAMIRDAGDDIDDAIVGLLLEAGCADIVNKRNKYGESALFLAILWAQLHVIPVLLSVENIKISMVECRQAADASDDRDKANECLREVAATVIQRQWRECYWNPNYLVCRKRLMEEGKAMERDMKRFRGSSTE